jgi:hypothetical protein
MTDQDAQAGLRRDPQEWVTGDEPATAAQRSYLETLAREAGEEVPDDLTKAQASEMIDRLRGQSPRLQSAGDGDTGRGEQGGNG